MTEEVTHTDICTWYSIVGNFCISGRKVHRINLCFNFRMLGLRDHAHAAHLLVQASPWHSMMPGLRGFLASVTIEGLVLTGLWVALSIPNLKLSGFTMCVRGQCWDKVIGRNTCIPDTFIQ